MQRLVRGMQEAIVRHGERTSPVHTVRVVGRNQDGTTQVLPLEGECVARGCGDNLYQGQQTEHPKAHCFTNAGTSGVAGLSVRGTVHVLWVERLEPPLLRAGESATVLVIGRGFSPSTEIAFLRLDGSVNADVTIDETRFVSETELELDVTVAAAALVLADGPIAYGDPAAGA